MAKTNYDDMQGKTIDEIDDTNPHDIQDADLSEHPTDDYDTGNIKMYRKRTFRAVPTTFKGVLMHSKTEADFAAALEGLGLDWKYERLCMMIPNIGQYKPDFCATFGGRKSIFEIKAVPNRYDLRKIQGFLSGMMEYPNQFDGVCGGKEPVRFYLADQDGELMYCYLRDDMLVSDGHYKPFLMVPAWFEKCDDCGELFLRPDNKDGQFRCQKCGGHMTRVVHPKGKRHGILDIGGVYEMRKDRGGKLDFTDYPPQKQVFCSKKTLGAALGMGCDTCPFHNKKTDAGRPACPLLDIELRRAEKAAAAAGGSAA